MTGLTEEHDNCALPLVRRVYALLGRDDSGVRTGDPLPRGWHFVLFTPTAPQTAIGPDGTAMRQGGPDAPADLPRRMMGGRRFTFFSDIPIGADVRRTSEVVSSAEKTGRSGRFMIRTTRTLIHVGDAKEPALQEDFDTLFRAPASDSAPAEAAGPPPQSRTADVREAIAIDETMLFRYSACTFNAHRIHYDQPYTTKTEGYPALVVNAGLTVLLLRELGVRLMKSPLRSMSTRNGRPIYCGTGVQLCAKAVDGGYDLWAEDEQKNVCAEVTLRS
jgi:3-methylfumaryl-CoA hydratase